MHHKDCLDIFANHNMYSWMTQTILPAQSQHGKVIVMCLSHYTRLQAMEDAKMKKEDIQEIVLVGGSTRIPMVQRMISDYFDGKQPNKGVNPDEAVAYGATLQAAVLSADGEDKVCKQMSCVSPLLSWCKYEQPTVRYAAFDYT